MLNDARFIGGGGAGFLALEGGGGGGAFFTPIVLPPLITPEATLLVAEVGVQPPLSRAMMGDSSARASGRKGVRAYMTDGSVLDVRDVRPLLSGE